MLLGYHKPIPLNNVVRCVAANGDEQRARAVLSYAKRRLARSRIKGSSRAKISPPTSTDIECNQSRRGTVVPDKEILRTLSDSQLGKALGGVAESIICVSETGGCTALVCNTIECISETGRCTDLCNLSANC